MALAGALAFSALAFAQEYDIRLSRPAKVGEKYRFTAHGTHTEVMTVSVDGRVAQQKGNEFSVDLISLLTVIATNEGGIPISYSLAIEKFIITTGGNSKSLVASEKVLLVSLDGNRYVFTLNEAPVDVSIYQALSAVIPTHTAGLTDDDVFGTREKKKVGDQWPINRELRLQRSRRHSISRRETTEFRELQVSMKWSGTATMISW